ncbi:MAG: hypothetical protein ACREBJ_10545 [Nitrosotalea sp.]
MLRELDKNGKIDFTEIDKRYNFDRGRSQYTFYKLKETGVIKRITISMRKLPIKYIGIVFKTIVNGSKFREGRQNSISDLLEESKTQINKYIFVNDTFSPDGSILYMPVFNYDDLDKQIEKLSDMNLGIKLTSLAVTNIVLGDFSYRKFDNTYSEQQEILEKEYNIPKKERINYEESGRKKKTNQDFGLDIRGAKKSN